MSKKHRYLREDESAYSPTVSLEGLVVTLVIDAYENRDVATFDIPGAYFYAPNPSDKQVLLNLKCLLLTSCVRSIQNIKGMSGSREAKKCSTF